MDHRKLFDDKADIYARARPRYPRELYAWLAAQCPDRERVWDAACGNGQAAADLRHHFGAVEASDISAFQIAQAPAYEGVRFSVQASEATSYPDAHFDAVCVAQALHWFDHARFWPEARRVLKPGGVFAAWGYTWPRLGSALDAMLDETLYRGIAPYWAPQVQLLMDGYRDLPLPFEPIAPPVIALSVAWSQDELYAYLHTWSAVRRRMEAEGEGFFWASRDRVATLWGEAERRPVGMDFFVVAGRRADG